MIRITWLKPEERVVHEFRQLREEGSDPTVWETRWQQAHELPLAEQRLLANQLLDELRHLRRDDDDLDGFVAALPRPAAAMPLTTEILRERLLGGWTGRMAGCLLGKPVEKIPREGIRAILESIGEWPLRQYFTALGVPAEVTDRYAWNRASLPTSMRENIECMPEDDDINFAMLNLKVLETYGETFTTDDIATTWLQNMPVLTVFTAERVAYVNLLNYWEPPETARYRNPYREWIGAQIRADLWGWISPGHTRRAAEFAWRDARLSHTGNGIYGEMYAAALIAASFTNNSMEAIIELGLAVIPADSRLAEAIRFSIELFGRVPEWEDAVDELYVRYGHYHWVHAINNAALLTAALLYGGSDFGKTISYAVMGGWDTDCNGATAGSVLGTMLGRAAIPESWAGPLRNRVRTSLKGFDNSSVDELAERTLRLVPATLRTDSSVTSDVHAAGMKPSGDCDGG